jgi:hypothetical protein
VMHCGNLDTIDSIKCPQHVDFAAPLGSGIAYCE